MSPRDDLTRLRDIQLAIAAVNSYAPALNEPDEVTSAMAIDAVKYHLLVIGEAAGDLTAATRTRAKLIPWAEITGLRNVLAHEYFRIDLELIRETINGNDLVELERVVKSLLNNESP